VYAKQGGTAAVADRYQTSERSLAFHTDAHEMHGLDRLIAQANRASIATTSEPVVDRDNVRSLSSRSIHA
jgi:hypothetical protein